MTLLRRCSNLKEQLAGLRNAAAGTGWAVRLVSIPVGHAPILHTSVCGRSFVIRICSRIRANHPLGFRHKPHGLLERLPLFLGPLDGDLARRLRATHRLLEPSAEQELLVLVELDLDAVLAVIV